MYSVIAIAHFFFSAVAGPQARPPATFQGGGRSAVSRSGVPIVRRETETWRKQSLNGSDVALLDPLDPPIPP